MIFIKGKKSSKLIFPLELLDNISTQKTILLIEKSFDCFSDRQISEISYVFNCLIYLLIGNLVSSLVNSIFETETLMKLYLNVVWFNLIFIFIYKVKMDRKKKVVYQI